MPSLKRKRDVENEAPAIYNEDFDQHGEPSTSLLRGDCQGTDDAIINLSLHSSSRRSAKDALSMEEFRISELERKLGIKDGKVGRGRTLMVDGLDQILGDIAKSDTEPVSRCTAEYASWLATKRARTFQNTRHSDRSSATFSNGARLIGPDILNSPVELLNDVAHPQSDISPKRENPYTAPVSDTTITTRYIPPPRRKPDNNEDNGARLRRHIQGLINRLTEDNMLSIVRLVEDMYQRNARGDVTSTLIEVLMAQVYRPEIIPDSFFVLNGGFVSAVYKVIGASFGSQLLTQTVASLQAEIYRARQLPVGQAGWLKESSNLVTFLTILYVFGVIGPVLILECLDLLLGDLSELSAELILRIIRLSGRQLRRDSPTALKDAIGMLNKSVAVAGGSIVLSTRTKYMIESINGLKSNKMKLANSEPTVISEHVQRMKKRLGELKAQSWRRLDGTTAMGVSLSDINKADLEGKWWLVGACVPANETQKQDNMVGSKPSCSALVCDEEDIDLLLPDYRSRAREQGLSTSAQLSIFTAIMSATDAAHGYQQFLALGLSAKERREISTVLIQCVGREASYNPYYALVARQACSHTQIRFALQDKLWGLFRRLGEPVFGENNNSRDAMNIPVEDSRVLRNVGTFFGALIYHSHVPVTVLRPLDLHNLLGTSQQLVEHSLMAILRACVKANEQQRLPAIEKIFGSVREFSTLARGIMSLLDKIGQKQAVKRMRNGSEICDTIALTRDVLAGHFMS
jgi:nucleolar MIF4G domain-containing protein 1